VGVLIAPVASNVRARADSHFWFAARRELLARTLCRAAAQGIALDVGAGGRPQLAEKVAHLRWIGIDRVPPADIVADAGAVPLASSSVAVIAMLDLLEHVDDEVALHEARRVLQPDGMLLVSVPALPSLWSYRDEAAGHLRRYSKRTLLALLRRNGFVVTRVDAYQCLLAPAVVAGRRLRPHSRRWRDLEDAPGPVLNRALGAVNRFEVRSGLSRIAPFGTSLVVLCTLP
jgi:SAM-dependent methyltransferase